MNFHKKYKTATRKGYPTLVQVNKYCVWSSEPTCHNKGRRIHPEPSKTTHEIKWNGISPWLKVWPGRSASPWCHTGAGLTLGRVGFTCVGEAIVFCGTQLTQTPGFKTLSGGWTWLGPWRLCAQSNRNTRPGMLQGNLGWLPCSPEAICCFSQRISASSLSWEPWQPTSFPSV